MVKRIRYGDIFIVKVEQVHPNVIALKDHKWNLSRKMGL